MELLELIYDEIKEVKKEVGSIRKELAGFKIKMYSIIGAVGMLVTAAYKFLK